MILPSAPRVEPLDADGVSGVLHEWLLRPELKEAILVTFAFDPEAEWRDPRLPATTLAPTILEAASRATVTLLLAATVAYDSTTRGERNRASLECLAKAGVRVRVHNSLHAKAYLLQEQERLMWIVGSSNLTSGGLERNAEISLRGYHQAEYGVVRRQVMELIDASAPL